jgi:N-acetylneuraminate synthase/N,N'-diacetyllegionaminate synthase
MEGPDHAASMEPDEFRRYVAAIRTVESALGDGRKRPTSGELETRKVVTRVVVARRAVPSGATIVPDDLALRRADGSIPLERVDFVVGRRARQSIAANEAIEWSMLE